MEGISYEAASLAGTLKLNKLIVLYDSNEICLDGKTNKTFIDNVPMRFISMGWNVLTVVDGEDYEQISQTIAEAKTSVDKPTLIQIKTTIGKYSELEGTNKVHGKHHKQHSNHIDKHVVSVDSLSSVFVSKEASYDSSDGCTQTVGAYCIQEAEVSLGKTKIILPQ